MDAKSEKSTGLSLRQSFLSQESVASESTKVEWGEENAKPAPPPPSPELKDSTRLNTKRGSTDSPMAILQEVAESDSEFTLTAVPPSNLDDISRINTPASNMLSSPANPAQSIMRQQTIEDFLSESHRRGSVPQEPVAQTIKVPSENQAPEKEGETETNIGKDNVNNDTLEAGLETLDTFDTTEADYKAELQAEYSKLSQVDVIKE